MRQWAAFPIFGLCLMTMQNEALGANIRLFGLFGVVWAAHLKGEIALFTKAKIKLFGVVWGCLSADVLPQTTFTTKTTLVEGEHNIEQRAMA